MARSQPSSTWAEAVIRPPLRSNGSLPPSRGTLALASLGLAPWLDASPRSARVMGTSKDYAWCAVDSHVMFLASLDSVRFPNAVLANAPWNRLDSGEEVVIGSGCVAGRAVDCRIVRWWDPKVTPAPATEAEVRAAVRWLDGRVRSPQRWQLENALTSGNRLAVLGRARRLLGCGRGLTPEGDDFLVGAIAAFGHVTTSLGRPVASRMLAELTADFLAVASTMTTRLSVALLRHAFAGQVADPIADLLHGMTGRGDLEVALGRCLDTGHSSGRAFASGVLSGARAACEAAQ